jgi:PIN domain nuclease of toxin-antitoxin system
MARHMIDDDTNSLLLSDVSALEIALKWSAGKLVLPAPPRVWVEEQIRRWSFAQIGLTRDDMYRASELPNHHADPFDRLLVATAMNRGATLLTPDTAIHNYPVAWEW